MERQMGKTKWERQMGKGQRGKDKMGKDKEGKTRGMIRGIVRENKYGRFRIVHI